KKLMKKTKWIDVSGIGTRFELLVLIGAFLLLIGFYLSYQPTKTVHATDPLIYLFGAESLAEGKGYRFIAHAGTPDRVSSAAAVSLSFDVLAPQSPLPGKCTIAIR